MYVCRRQCDNPCRLDLCCCTSPISISMVVASQGLTLLYSRANLDVTDQKTRYDLLDLRLAISMFSCY